MNRRDFLQYSMAGACAAVTATRGAAQAAAAARPRNMVFILIDDMRFDGMSCAGHPFLQTPRLDALASTGMMFERAYVTTALCSPSRASILTGTYAHRHGVLDNATPLPEELPIFPQALQQAGYRTAFIGKWHMGGESDAPRAGFDHWVSFRGQGVYVDPQFNINGARQQVTGYVTDLLTDQAVDFLKGSQDKPFFLYLSHKAVHANFTPAPRHAGCYAQEKFPRPVSMADTDENYRGKPQWVRAQRASWHGVDGMYNKEVDFDDFVVQYAETLRAVDDSVGRVVDTLRELELLDSTLILFTSDNGFLMGEHGLIDKRCMYEPSIRVPLIAHCPNLIAAGSHSSSLVTNVDVAPTILEAAGLDAPESFQGRSFLPVLRGEESGGREVFLYEYFWERSFSQTPTVLGVHDGRYKFMQYHGVWDTYELYDLQADPNEMHNLLGDLQITTQGGTLDNLINHQAAPDLLALIKRMQGLLREQLAATGCRPEPRW
ncbi:MAG: sulfatase [Candidatus Hydrogenedentes bacterium]|nr:sulfatase [Candidatus Hydrogenedentota bacterium]